MRKCPKCERRYIETPVISRKDKETEICPVCGMKEALDAAGIIEGSSVRGLVIEVAEKQMRPCYIAGEKVKYARREAVCGV